MFKKQQKAMPPTISKQTDEEKKVNFALSQRAYDIAKVLYENTQKTIKREVFNRTDVNIDTDTTYILNKFLQSSFFVVFIVLVCVFLYFASTDPQALTKNTYIYVVLIIIPIVAGIYFTYPFFVTDGGGSSSILYLAIFIILLVVFIYYATSGMSSLMSSVLNYLGLIIIISCIIVALGIFFLLFKNSLQKQTGALGFWINVVFYIPCLFNEFVAYMREQFSLTPNSVYISFVVEIVLCSLYLSYPYIIDYVLKKNATILLMSPMFLSSNKIVATSETFILSTTPYTLGLTPNVGIKPTYRDTNYSIAFWVYVNPSTSADLGYVRESDIFNYAGGKPRMTFVCDGVNRLNTVTVYMSNSPNASGAKFENIAIPLQKWNYVVFNYYRGVADFFVNAELIRSVELIGDNMPLSGTESDTIRLGDANGIVGAICNVNYYKMPLPMRQITDNYNLLQNENPPIITSALGANTAKFSFGKFDYFSSNKQ